MACPHRKRGDCLHCKDMALIGNLRAKAGQRYNMSVGERLYDMLNQAADRIEALTSGKGR